MILVYVVIEHLNAKNKFALDDLGTPPGLNCTRQDLPFNMSHDTLRLTFLICT
jgi:hypothetical protein